MKFLFVAIFIVAASLVAASQWPGYEFDDSQPAEYEFEDFTERRCYVGKAIVENTKTCPKQYIGATASAMGPGLKHHDCTTAKNEAIAKLQRQIPATCRVTANRPCTTANC